MMVVHSLNSTGTERKRASFDSSCETGHHLLFCWRILNLHHRMNVFDLWLFNWCRFVLEIDLDVRKYGIVHLILHFMEAWCCVLVRQRSSYIYKELEIRFSLVILVQGFSLSIYVVFESVFNSWKMVVNVQVMYRILKTLLYRYMLRARLTFKWP